MGLLPHWIADPDHHPEQRASAVAQHLPGAMVEGFGLLSRGDARGCTDGGFAGPAGGVEAGAAPGRLAAGRFLDGRSNRPLSHLVCAEHPGARRHICGGMHAVGAGVCATRPRPQAVGRGCVVHGSRPFERDGHCHPVDPGGDGHCDRPAGGSAVAVPLVARSAVVDELCGPAGWLVCLALCKDRLPLRQS